MEIIRSFKAEYEHRHLMETTSLEADIAIAHKSERHITRGQYCGLVIALAGIGGGVYLVATGHDIAGASIVGVPLASILAAFLKSSADKQKTTK